MSVRGKCKKILLAAVFVAGSVCVCWLAQRNIKNDVERSVFVIILAAVALGYFLYKIFGGSVSELRSADNEMADGDLDSEAQARYVARLEEILQKLSAKLSSANLKLETEIASRPTDQRKLQQQVKHLNCFYGLSKLVNTPQITLEQILEQTPELIHEAYCYPDITCVRITLDGVHYKTDNFQKSEFSQCAPINVRGDKAGAVEAYYFGKQLPGDESPLLAEEQDLLEAVAQRLGALTERKRAGEKLELFRDLIDRSNDCIFVIEPEWGRILDTNYRACEDLGYTRQELLDMTVKDIEESIKDDSTWQEHVKELKLEGDILIQGQLKRKNATKFFVETSLKLVSQAKKDYIIAITRDITERKQAEQRQAELIQELKDFAYIVSHDLKAPLRGIKTLADWISTDYADKLDEQGKEQMDLLLKRVERMHNLIDGVLQYSRVGRVTEEKVQVDLNELIPNVIDMVAAPENIEITVEDKLPVIECEQTRIMQVFENLLSNAVKYMDKPKGLIKIGCVQEDGFWKFSVADNGPGIEEQHFEKIFRIFQTLSSRDEFESTGIGLTVIKKIVELYGGKIWLESKVGEGSTFFFTLPKQTEEVADAKLQANIAR
ncbi:MAG: PAS domain S-box protein [Planctomycetota bacterium]|nr:MAG: PAS domain S-box protein [Planctomycetota bacterium]